MSEETPRHELIWPEAGIQMPFRLIPKGEFRMGSHGRTGYDVNQEPVRRVKIEHDFWLGETVVTQAQFALWTKAAGVEHENDFPGRPNHPAENITWRQAVQFCAWLTKVKRRRFPAGFDLACLPTEAEWEYACRAGTTSDYYNGDGEGALAEVGWYEGNSGEGTHAVDELAEKHPYGLRGLHGNVSEWCHDVWDGRAYQRAVDGDDDPGWRARGDEYRAGVKAMLKSDRTRVLRGGSWYFSARRCRSAYRDWYWPVGRHRRLGFRVCLVRGPVPQPAGLSAEAQPATGVGGRGTRPQTDGAGVAGADVLEHFRLPPRPRA